MALMTRPQFSLDWPAWRTSRPFFSWPDLWDGMGTDFEVRVEEYEKADSYVVRAEVPGIDIDKNVELSVQNQQLHLVIHRERREKSSDTRHFRSEFQYGSFTRIIPLPVTASEKDVKATYKDGILEIRIKLDGTQSQGHRIPITTE